MPDDRSHTYLQPGQTGTEAQQGPPGQAKLFSHAHKGELSRSFVSRHWWKEWKFMLTHRENTYREGTVNGEVQEGCFANGTETIATC